MAYDYKTPGVYLEEIVKLPPSVASVETAIPCFFGVTEKAKENENDTSDNLILVPKKIKSFADFEYFFGKADVVEMEFTIINEHITNVKINSTYVNNLYYAVKHYFDNGGGPAYIISINTYDNVSKIDDETYKNALKKLKSDELDEVTLVVLPDIIRITDDNKYYGIYNHALKIANELKDKFVIIDTKLQYDNTTKQIKIDDSKKALRDIISNNSEKKYGAAYFPNLNTTYSYDYGISRSKITFSSSSEINDISAIDSTSIIETKLKAAFLSIPVILPPSAAIAGVYANVDRTRGVWKAPANVSLNAVVKPEVFISDIDQKDFNVDATNGKSINCIRQFVGRGNLVWGARTLAGNDDEWKYVNVRRFFNMVEESCKNAANQFVFEPNDANTWVRVKGMIDNYLTNLWRSGALQGAKPEHAFYVSVGLNQTMTANDILNGYLIVEIGLAVVRPAEFIILRFSHKLAVS